MNPRDYQALAARLLSGPGSPAPADCRAAISRAYYAAFNVAAELLRSMGLPVGRGAAAHGEVRHCLSNAGDADALSAANALADLHTQRNRADYQMDRPDVERPVRAGDLVRQAAAAIQMMDAAFSGPQRGQLEAAIRAWRRANGYT